MSRRGSVNCTALAAALLQIYRAARSEPLHRFQDSVMQRLEPLFGFDSAIWGMGLGSPAQTYISSVHLHQQPERMMRSYEAARSGDVLAQRACANAGRAVRLGAMDPDVPEAPRRHMLKFGMRYVQCVALFDAELGLFNFTSLFREAEGNEWTEDTGVLHEALMPHLAEAYLIARSRDLEQAGPHAQAAAQALADANLMTTNLTPAFRRLLLTEWPRWKGPHMPEEVRAAFGGDSVVRYDGRRITLSGNFADGLYVLTARPMADGAPLSPREREVARQLVRGLSHKQIAAALAISPNTVRNHIATLYAKLDVSNRVSLVQRLAVS